MRRISRIKRALGRGRCRCLKQDVQDVQDGQDDSTLSRGWCKCLKQDGQDFQDGQDKEGFCFLPMSH